MLKIVHQSKINLQDTIVLPIFQNEKRTLKTGSTIVDAYISSRIKAKDFEGKTHEILSGFLDIGKSTLTVILLGLGKESDCTEENIRETGGHLGKKLRSLKKKKVQITQTINDQLALALYEGISLANYRQDLFKTDKESATPLLETITIINSKNDKAWQKILTARLIVIEHIHQARNLINSPADNIYPESLAEKAKEISKKHKLTLTVLREKEIVKQNLGLLWAVGKGSMHKPRLIVLTYNGGKRGSKPIMLVGKGITFDSGGYNLKPTNYIEDMYMDMAGGATVMATIAACSELKLPINVVAIVAAAENLVSSSAFKPSDVITSFSGKTVEITNTDAEGRLVLADAISYGIKHFKPQAIIDLATLTGACMVALGDRYSGVFSNDEKLLQEIKTASKNTDELIWELPMHPDYDKRLKSDKADMVNCDVKSRMAGASTAAAFIKKFAGETPWLHLDIAGTAMGNSPRAHDYAGASGFGVRLLINYLSNHSS